MRDIATANRRIGVVAAVVPAVVLACATAAPPAADTSPSPTPTSAIAARSLPSASPTTNEPIVLEDAGVSVELQPGRYTSRLFRPRIVFDLPSGWMRAEAVGDRSFRLRPLGDDAVLTVLNVDFAQCRATLLRHPPATEIADLMTRQRILSPSRVAIVQLGDRIGAAIDLPGTGRPGDETKLFETSTGCVLTAGKRPFPHEGLWAVFDPGLPAHVVLVDVGDQPIAFVARAFPESLAEFGAHVDSILSTVRFPDEQPQD